MKNVLDSVGMALVWAAILGVLLLPVGLVVFESISGAR